MDVVGASSAVVASVGAPAGSTVSAVSVLVLVSTMSVGRSFAPVVGEASRRIARVGDSGSVVNFLDWLVGHRVIRLLVVSDICYCYCFC